MSVEQGFGSSKKQRQAERSTRHANREPNRLHGVITKLIDRAEVLDKRADRYFEESEYKEIRIGMLRWQGKSEFEALRTVRAEKLADPQAFATLATDLFAYRARVTEDGAITQETFQGCLDANPQAVLNDSIRWAETRNLLAAAKSQPPTITGFPGLH